MRTFSLRKVRLALTGMAAIACLGLSAGESSATTTATSSFQVTVTVQATCTVNSTQTMNFGSSQGLLAANVDAHADIVVTCTETTPYHVGLDAGASAGATVTTRKMTSGGGSTIDYSLYSDNYTTNWGNTPSTDTVDAVGTGIGVTHRVYGRVPPQKTPAPDTYTDTITVTVTY
jgi:spore coat protein U-like protein